MTNKKSNKKIINNMKKILGLSTLVIIALVSLVIGQGKGIKVKGSDTVLPLSQKEAEKYMKANPGSSITVIGGGSGVGIAALIDGTTDIAQSSRKLKMDEKLKFQEAGRNIKEVQVAWDALSLIVNPANSVKQLTREQIEGIYTGKIKNWKEVGGADMAIVAYSRESSSGTYEFFKEHVMNKKNFGTSILNMPATGAIVQSVSQTKGAIGYIGFAYMEKTVRDIKVSYDKGKTFIEPTVANAKSKVYPITRPLFYYFDKKIEKQVSPFVNYILSAEGQKNVADVGYISLN
jgi:phosphate transport system substrate-binding protein